MQGREEGDPGYDDWFDEPEPPTDGTSRPPARSVYDDGDDVWVLPEEDEPRHRGRRGGIVVAGRLLTENQLAILGASLVAIILAILAATGVFSSGRPAVQSVSTPPPPTITSTSTRTSTTPGAQAPSTTLKPGDTGKQVKTLQRALTALGFSPGKADGDYGPATQTEVEKFQTSKGLTADGIVGPQTLEALQHALSG